jgi:transcription termination factor NusB
MQMRWRLSEPSATRIESLPTRRRQRLCAFQRLTQIESNSEFPLQIPKTLLEIDLVDTRCDSAELHQELHVLNLDGVMDQLENWGG